MKLCRGLLTLLLAGVFSAAPLAAQQPPCPAPTIAPPANVAILFTEQQESDLGDAIAERVQRNYKVIDDEVTELLRRVGQRLLAQLPPTKIRFQFLLVDVPEVNAYGFLGGRIYITRKLVAATQSEDELAGVVAHEMGHIITRQMAIDFTKLFQRVLGVTSVGGREDIFEKYHQFMENVARNPKVMKDVGRDAEDDQLVADRVAVYLTKRAGYNADAYSQMWNRVFQVGGKTGSAFSDLFGFTKPEQRRLREMLRLAASLPESCAGPRSETSAEQYSAWKAAVLAYTGLGRRESLRAVAWKRPLQPQLRGFISHLKFSRDGKYVLAQDGASIYVLSREPFQVLFRIDAPDALPAQFSPDSQSVVFHTPELRVEMWNVAEEHRTLLEEMTVQTRCLQTKVSPDARYLACLDDDLSMILFEVATGNRLLVKKEFYDPNIRFLMSLLASLRISATIDVSLSFVEMDFSPDGKSFLAAESRDKYVAYDLSAGKPIRLPLEIQKLLNRKFAFMEGNRFVAVGGPPDFKGMVTSYPEGKVLQEFDAGLARPTPATRGNYLLLRPITKYPVGVLNLESKKIFMANRQSALDLYEKLYVSERTDGVLFLFHADSETPLGRAELPQTPLARLRAVAVSPDLNWLAVSESSRGAVWDLREGKRAMLTRGFRGAQFSADNVLYADFPKQEDEERMIARINPVLRHVSPAASLKDSEAHQDGRFLVELHESGGRERSGKNQVPTLIVSDATTGQQIWFRPYPKGLPWEFFNPRDNRAVLGWSANSDFVKEESKTDPELKRRIESKKERQDDYYLHVVEATTGHLLGKVYVETGMGSFRLRAAFATGDYVALYDTSNRLLLYSISTGKQIGRIFGAGADISTTASLLAAENERGVITFYKLPSLEKCAQLSFSSTISLAQFSADGRRFLVVTSDQVAYLIDVTAKELLAASND